MILLDLVKPEGMSDVAWKSAKKKAIAAAKAATPVRTGRLKAGWRLIGDQLVNDMPYGGYVNDGTPRMAARDMTGVALSALRGRP